MKKLSKTLALLFLLISATSTAQDLKCQKYRAGKFELSDTDADFNTIVTRKRDSQIEYVKKYTLKVEFKVKWIDECTYELRFDHYLLNPNKLDLNTDMVVTVEIIETGKNYYIQRTSSNVSDKIQEGRMTKL